MPLPLTVSCFSKIQTGFSFLVPAHPGSPGQRAVNRVCVCLLILVNIQCTQQTSAYNADAGLHVGRYADVLKDRRLLAVVEADVVKLQYLR